MKRVVLITLFFPMTSCAVHWWQDSTKQSALFYFLQNDHNEKRTNEIEYTSMVQGFAFHASKALMKETKHHEIVHSPLSRLLFQSSSFSPSQALTNGNSISLLAPLVDQLIGPRMKIDQRGLYVGLQASYKINDEWSLVGRVHLPFSKITVKKTAPALTGKSLFGGPVVTDFYDSTTDIPEGANKPIEGFAIRLDLASKLPATINPPGNKVPWITYHDSSSGRFKINGELIYDVPFVTVIQTANGTKPATPYGILKPNADLLPALSGAGAVTGLRARLDETIDYTPLAGNQAAQSDLWLVPTAANVASTTIINFQAYSILQNFKSLIANVYETPEASFQDNNVSFDDYHKSGIGDMQCDLFARYHINKKDFCECGFSFEVPTSKQITPEDSSVFAVPLGKNGHATFSSAVRGIHNAGYLFDIAWSSTIGQVLSTQEYIPAAFMGATVTNFNPLTPAFTSWTTVKNSIDLSLKLPSYYQSMGSLMLVCGYEFYFKSKTNIRFVYAKAYDGTGSLQPLNAQLASKNSQQQSHTISGKLFYKHTLVNLFGSFEYVVGGNNTPCRSGWQIGIEKTF
ncbi:hypothetical protein IPH25_01875 [bacterium]|nr:MAG: hypothetical protein IPG37_04005 [bacterium]QQR62174.1 MAG: hypothetical protein IPH25_01875 [bacterium]QQR63268.1 MAG: hypothetical protein IPH67_02225 [bacterium]